MKQLFLIILIPLLFTCQKDNLYTEGDYFFLRNKGADMPVWVRGNINSKVFIIHLHGGPGGSSINEAEQKVYLDLEKDYTMVYWDQRGSGCSQGKAKPETMTMEQFVEDLEKLVAVIKSKYNNPIVFLHGHSWGGALGTAFLIKGNNQNLINGWIELDGAHNFKKGLESSVNWIKNYAQNQISIGRDVSFWQDALDWYSANSVMTTVEQMKIHCDTYLPKANGYIYDINNPSLSNFTGGTLNSPGGYSNGDYAQKNLVVELLKGYSDQMFKITIPTLILWGQHDGILPVDLAQDAIDHLGTPTNDKSVYIFQNSAHSPNREEPTIFNEKMRSFIEQYR
jgi:pimeloyl-ACP methyl ester carboxylesterase